ncbi:MAG TPA: hypothetical protein VI078_12195 [bacterium]
MTPMSARLAGRGAIAAAWLAALLAAGGVSAGPPAGAPAGTSADAGPPFALGRLAPVTSAAGAPAYDPQGEFAIFVNYELGMHCVGFDISYCCIIPPYNSVQAQALRTARDGGLPRLLTPADGLGLAYAVADNSYSEGNKMRYWGAAKDVDGNGGAGNPGDSMANYVWSHLFIYRDLAGTLPPDWRPEARKRIGVQLQVPVDAGPSGMSLAGGRLAYAGDAGGNVVFTDSLLPSVRNVRLTLTAANLWDALGLPLTAFNDSRRRGSIRSVTERDFQPYQRSVVSLVGADGAPVPSGGRPVSFFGTNPVDFPECYLCHAGAGPAAARSRGEGLSLFDREYAYWKAGYPDVSEFMARQYQAAINVLELHDRHHGTAFLRAYDAAASSDRLGAVGPVNCADCHGDNISGNLEEPRPRATGYPAVKARPLTEAIHMTHALDIPMPDRAGRTQSCQACHPTHWQPEAMNDLAANPYRVIDAAGNPRFSDGDVRAGGGGCYLRRDAHANPQARPPFFLNPLGKWYLREVSLKDESGASVTELRGLYCTNCHSPLAQALYRADDLEDAAAQRGATLRDGPVAALVGALAGGDESRFRRTLADPVVGAEGEPLRAHYERHAGATLVRAARDAAGAAALLPWNAAEGEPVPYEAVSGGSDWWLSPAEPHCADCHLPPFVESAGGRYFPVDQPRKYALYRYSKAHGALACQSCHESVHGLYPVRFDGPDRSVDLTTHEQALQFSPDGVYAGPVTCAACHRVNARGVPVQLEGTGYAQDYWAAVVLLHAMRDGDEKLPLAELLARHPYDRARSTVLAGWD